MRTSLPNTFNSKDEAIAWIRELVHNGEDFHFDDSPETVIVGRTGQRLFTDEEAAQVRVLVEKCCELLEDPFEVLVNETLDRRDFLRENGLI